MSYEILYNKIFIRLQNDNYIPLICSGSNNTYDCNCFTGKYVRAKDWWNIGQTSAYDNITDMNEEFLLEHAFTSDYDELFRNRTKTGKWITNEEWIRHLKAGIRNAMTFEKFTSLGNVLIIRGGIYTDNRYISSKSYQVSCDEEYYQALSDIKEEMKEKLNSDVKFKYDFNVNYGEPKVKRQAERKKRTRKPLDSYYAIKIIAPAYDSYFVRKLKFGYKYSWSISHARKFRTEKSAEEYINNTLIHLVDSDTRLDIVYHDSTIQ